MRTPLPPTPHGGCKGASRFAPDFVRAGEGPSEDGGPQISLPLRSTGRNQRLSPAAGDGEVPGLGRSGKEPGARKPLLARAAPLSALHLRWLSSGSDGSGAGGGWGAGGVERGAPPPRLQGPGCFRVRNTGVRGGEADFVSQETSLPSAGAMFLLP